MKVHCGFDWAGDGSRPDIGDSQGQRCRINMAKYVL